MEKDELFLKVKPEALEKRIKEGKVKPMSKQDNELNYKRIIVHDCTYFWAEGASGTSVYNEVKQVLFILPFFVQERDVRMALFGYLQCALRQFIHETRKGETE